jgi:GNAT superfamily N-acetyltransferase
MTKAFTLKERPELEPDYERLADLGWPRFMRQRDELGCGRYWSSLFTEFADYQFAICNTLDRVVAVAHTVPFAWDGADETLPESIAAILKNATDARRASAPVTALSALAVLVDPAQRGQGLSRLALTVMAQMAGRHGLGAFVAPVRPTHKPAYPLAPMERYVAWCDGEGLPLDPWMRIHAKLGARVVRVMPRSMVIAGTVAEWEQWTGMRFPDPGAYVVPGALQPVVIDRECETGRYEDPNVWMRHA